MLRLRLPGWSDAKIGARIAGIGDKTGAQIAKIGARNAARASRQPAAQQAPQAKRQHDSMAFADRLFVGHTQ